VICVFEDGYKMTVGEFKKIYAILPPETQQTALAKREDFLKGWAVMRKLAQMAKADKLDEGSPAREQLDYYSMRILTDAEMLDTSHKVSVPPGEAKQYYDAHRDNYKEVQLKAIYLSFSDGAAPTTSSATSSAKRTEEQTKVLAAKLTADLRGGADFVKLVEQYSDDSTSKAKAGDFATIHGSDNIPQEVKSVVMGLKQGDVSEPLRQPSAIYIFRAETVSYKPFEQVSDEILNQLKTEHFRVWLDSINRNIKVEFKSQEFLNAPAPAEVKPSGAH
jgi:peptidyl-prolyl cis-trans isomerase C